MSLSKEPAFSLLRNKFVCGYKDISNEPYSGNSGAHSTNGNAVETTNGAGSHNIQMFIMDADGTVLHCLPGYWNPDDLSGELRLAERLDSVWKDNSMSLEQKKAQFSRMQMDHFRQHSKELTARSHMQGFDKQHELTKGSSDTIRLAACSGGSCPNSGNWDERGADDMVKTTDEIMHERMSKRPFVAYTSFDTGKFADYGTHFYDKHEDSLDESGKNTEPEAKMVTMREVLARQNHIGRGGGGRGRAQGHGHVPRLQVKTYGRLRSTAQ